MKRYYIYSLSLILFLIATCSLAHAKKVNTKDTPEDNYYLKGKRCYYRIIGKKDSAYIQKHLPVCAEFIEKALKLKQAPPDKCHYLLGQIYHKLHDTTGNTENFKKALLHYRTITQKFPKSNLADDAQFLIAIMYSGVDIEQAYLEMVKVETLFPEGDMVPKARKKALELKERLSSIQPPDVKPALVITSPAQIEEIIHWSAKDYTRVVIYLTSKVKFEVHELPAEKDKKLPPRLYVDFFNCLVGNSLKQPIPVMDGLLKRIRVGQFKPKQSRVVLDIESINKYRVFSLEDPYRLVIDVYGSRTTKQARKKPDHAVLNNLAEQLGLRVRTIVIDPGHGGKDKGAIGPSGLYEKDITLKIARELKKIIEQQTNCKVFLTRNRDVFLSLEKRTAIANAKKADLFISIHTNAHRDPRIGGIETYYLNFSQDREAARVAALENAISTRKISDLEAILKDLLFVTKVSESAELANRTHRCLIKSVRKKYRGIRNLGVKRAPFYVLIGANMPSILVEVAFISNPREEKLLKSARFRRQIALGIAEGIKDYARAIEQIAKTGAR